MNEHHPQDPNRQPLNPRAFSDVEPTAMLPKECNQCHEDNPRPICDGYIASAGTTSLNVGFCVCCQHTRACHEVTT